ncbi:NAD(P)/FAD-dependent oxidoreductase [Kiritimatiellota bacterium B12222]|nr:NAD(P)/FAD-dependent oxidoreductase [Kiritimatiellota bacterium B12222]
MEQISNKNIDVVVAGGGAAGFFAAIHAKMERPDLSVLILEKSKELLAKVAISGGGRCNVTHHCFEPKELITRYPRGGRELLGPFHRFQPSDTIEWFESRGVKLKTEEDGRMFPVSDDSGDIIRALRAEAEALGVKIQLQCGVMGAEQKDEGYVLTLTDNRQLFCRALILATGGNRASGGWAIAEQLGHHIIQPVPSLFSFHVQDPVFNELAGVSVDPVAVSIPEMNAMQLGAMLVTHKGLSGPAILKLSAWQARELAERQDQVKIEINWVPSVAHPLEELQRMRKKFGARPVLKSKLFELPRRLWEKLCIRSGIENDIQWARLTVTQEEALFKSITAMDCQMRGKTLNKEEFVTCGGVDLKEVNMKKFQSRLHETLFFAGEVLNIDGVTGGFNFQAAWTGGFLAGSAAVEGL